eukprot:gene29416-38510_t
MSCDPEMVDLRSTLCKKLLIGDVEVDVPLPCLQKQRKLSFRSQQKQIKKKQVYAQLYNEVFSAKDEVAAIHGSSEESKAGVTTSSADDVVVVEEDGTADSINNTVDNTTANGEHKEHEKRKREGLLSEARRTCRVTENKKFKKRRKERAVSNSKCSWTVAVKLDGSTMRTGYHDRSQQKSLKTEEEEDNHDNNNNGW